MADEHAWTERARIGRWRAFWRTVLHALGNPSKLSASLPQTNVLLGAILFAELVVMLTIIVMGAPLAIVLREGISMFNFSWGGPILASVALVGFALVAIGLAALAAMTLWGLIVHGILRLTGGVGRSLSNTLAITLFCSAPFILSAIPCCGFYVSFISVIWMTVAMIHALACLHRATLMRTALAVLTPIVVLVLSIVLTIVGIVQFATPIAATPIVVTVPPATVTPTTPIDPPTDSSDAQSLPASAAEAPEK